MGSEWTTRTRTPATTYQVDVESPLNRMFLNDVTLKTSYARPTLRASNLTWLVAAGRFPQSTCFDSMPMSSPFVLSLHLVYLPTNPTSSTCFALALLRPGSNGHESIKDFGVNVLKQFKYKLKKIGSVLRILKLPQRP